MKKWLLLFFFLPAISFSLDLFEAASEGDTNALSAWINGVDLSVDFTDGDGYTPLCYAVWSNQKDAASFLIDAGADINFVDPDGDPVIFGTLYETDETELLELFLTSGADIDVKNSRDQSLLFCASRAGNASAVELLLANGTDPDEIGPDHQSAVEYAIFSGDQDLLEYLVGYGVDLSALVLIPASGVYDYDIEVSLLELAIRNYLNEPEDLKRALIVNYLADIHNDSRSFNFDFDSEVPESVSIDSQIVLGVLLDDLNLVKSALKLGADPLEGNLSAVTLSLWCENSEISSYFQQLGFSDDSSEEIALALDSDDIAWIPSGEWTLDEREYYYFQDGDSLKSPPINNNESASLSALIDAEKISFSWKSSTESGYDFLTLEIDGVYITQISGLTEWQNFTYEMDSGIHEIVFRFSKDGSQSDGEDAVWIDAFTYE